MDAKANPLVNTGDAGGDGKLKPGSLDAIKAELRHVVTRAGVDVAHRRRLSERVLYNRRPGKSDDGRKHAEKLGQEAFPFEGASDCDVKLADLLVKEQIRLRMTALKNMTLRGVDARGDGLAGMLAKLGVWMVKNKLNTTWYEEWRRLLRYGLGDSPAVAAMGVFWNESMSITPKTVSIDSLAAEAGQPPEVIESLIFGGDPDSAGNLAALLTVVFPGASPKDLKRAARELATVGETTVNLSEIVESGPRVMADRFMQGIFLPENTARYTNPRYTFSVEWLSEVELRERIHTEDYDEDAVEETLKYEGINFLPLLLNQSVLRGVNATWQGVTDLNAYRGLYQVITCWYRASNDAGVPAMYRVVLNGSASLPLKDRTLSPYDHGCTPFVFFAHEALSNRAWDSRSIPELVMTEQYTLKLHTDAINDNAQLASLPPIKRPAKSADVRMTLQPLGEILEMRPGEISWMTPPEFPSAAKQVVKDTMDRVNEYFARPVEGVSARMMNDYAQEAVDGFMPCVAEVMHLLVANGIQFMSADELERIVPGLGAYAGMDARELRGRYDFVVSFDARTLDIDWLKTMGDLIGNYVLSWDTLNVVDRGELVRWFVGKIDTDALPFISTNEAAAAHELKDEDANFAFISAGGEPPMMASGQNFAARYQRLLQDVQKNPESVAAWPEKNREVLAARLEHLKFQSEQAQNAQIGRVGAEPVLQAGR